MNKHTDIIVTNDIREHTTRKDGSVTWYVKQKDPSDKLYTSLGMCGVQATRVCSDVELSYAQVIYLFSRLRSSKTSERSNHKICMWVAKTGLFIAIGEHLWEHKFNSEGRYDRDLLNQWLDIALQETFE